MQSSKMETYTEERKDLPNNTMASRDSHFQGMSEAQYEILK